MLESTMTKAIVYSKDNCPQCDKLKKELDRDGVEYVELKLDRDITRDEFLRQFPHVRAMPHLVIA
jgi:glutaredoxin